MGQTVYDLCDLVKKAVLEGNGENYDELEGSLYSNLIMLGSLVVGTILTWLTKETLKRQNAHLSEQRANQHSEKGEVNPAFVNEAQSTSSESSDF